MDWRSVTFDWNRARAFLVAAEEGSLSAAARALRMTQPTLGRQVAALEAELGVTLFERVGRGLTLTQAGVELMEHARSMGDAALAVSLAASGQAKSVEGHVAITASEIYSAWVLPPVLVNLARIAPGISVEVVASNAIRDLKRREADVALRNAQPQQPDLIAKRLCDDEAALFATPEYCASLGKPCDFSKAQFLGIDEPSRMVPAFRKRGLDVDESQFRLTSNSHLVHLEMARAGLGVGILPVRMGEDDPRLQRVSQDAPKFSFPVWLVAHRELLTNQRVRVVYDCLAGMVPQIVRGTTPEAEPKHASHN